MVGRQPEAQEFFRPNNQRSGGSFFASDSFDAQFSCYNGLLDVSHKLTAGTEVESATAEKLVYRFLCRMAAKVP